MDNRDSAAVLISRPLLSVEKKDQSWFFTFGSDVQVITESPWRLISQKAIEVTSEDHGHPFGLPQPIDAAKRLRSQIGGRIVAAASIDPPTGDLNVEFSDDLTMEFLQMSCGYESWRLNAPGRQVICLGGGDIGCF